MTRKIARYRTVAATPIQAMSGPTLLATGRAEYASAFPGVTGEAQIATLRARASVCLRLYAG